MLFRKMNFKAMISVLAGLTLSFAADISLPAPENVAPGIWVQQVGDIMPHATVKGTIYYTRYEKNDRIKSIDYTYDGAGYLQINTASMDTLCTEADGVMGADGMVLHPDGDLLVAGQGNRIYKVDKTAKKNGSNCLVKTSYPKDAKEGFWHLMMQPDGENLWAAGIPGYLYRFSTKIDPSNSNLASTGYQVELRPQGPKHKDDKKLATVIWDGEGTAFFTYSDYNGGGCVRYVSGDYSVCPASSAIAAAAGAYFGVFTDTTWVTVDDSNIDKYGGKKGDRVIASVGTRVLIDSLEGAHGGVYDPYSKTIFVFGGAKIVQIQPYGEQGVVKAKVVATIDMREYFFEETIDNLTGPRTSGVGWRLDHGAVDGLGHLFVTSHTGHLIFVDYAANPNKLINDNVFIHLQWIDNSLDGLVLLSESQLAETYKVSENISSGARFGEFYAYDNDTSGVTAQSISITDMDDCVSGTNCAQDLFDVAVAVDDNEDPVLNKYVFVTKQSLDYETLYKANKRDAIFNVKLNIKDTEGTETVKFAKIKVLDVNEKPVFNESSYLFSIREDVKDTNYVGSVAAVDPDAGATVTYSLEGEESVSFVINKNTGKITTGKNATFDYETKSSYTFEIVASDGILENRVPVTVNVTDVSEKPIFSSSLTTVFYIDENAASGTKVGTVVATDDDCKGDFSKSCALPIYSLSPFVGSEEYGDVFTIDSDGTIKLAKDNALVYKEKSVYEYHVVATDGSDESLVSSIDVTINVRDIPHGPKIIDDGLNAYNVAETTSDSITLTGSEIACYEVSDDNPGQVETLTASFVDIGSTKAGDLFKAQIKKVGSLYKLCLVVKDGSKLDYETVAHTHKVKISVTDSDMKTASLTKTINITDVNEKPSISGNLTNYFYEHEGANFLVGQLHADDPDTSKAFTDNAFKAVGGDTDLFMVTEDGLIKTKRDFDYEKETRYSYTLDVSLYDRDTEKYPEYNSSAKVLISLKDSSHDPIESSSSKAESSSSAKLASSSSNSESVSSSSNPNPASSSSNSKPVSSSSKKASSSSSQNTPESSASSSNSNASENDIPTFHIRVVAPFEFEIVMDESLPSLAKQYAVMDMMGHVLSTGELSERDTRVHVSTRGAYVVRVGLGYKRVNVK